MTAVGCTLTAPLACAAQACCPSTCRTSVRSARFTHSMRRRGRSRRRSKATRRPAPTATASRATRPCPSAATGGAAGRGRRRIATRTPTAPSGARSAPTPSGSARGRRGRRGTRSGWADREYCTRLLQPVARCGGCSGLGGRRCATFFASAVCVWTDTRPFETLRLGRDGRTARRHHTGILRRGVWCASRRPPLGVCLFLSLFASVPLRFSLQPSCHLAVFPLSSFSLLSLLLQGTHNMTRPDSSSPYYQHT